MEDTQPHLGVLEEDDEFEEFQVQGMFPERMCPDVSRLLFLFVVE